MGGVRCIRAADGYVGICYLAMEVEDEGAVAERCVGLGLGCGWCGVILILPAYFPPITPNFKYI